MSTPEATYPWTFQNKTGKEIKRFETFRVSGFTDTNERGIVLKGEKHKEDNGNEATGINSATKVAIDKYGTCNVPGLAWAVAAGTTAHDDQLGPKKDQATLAKDEEGFIQIGSKDTTLGAVMVFRPGGGGGGTPPGRIGQIVESDTTEEFQGVTKAEELDHTEAGSTVSGPAIKVGKGKIKIASMKVPPPYDPPTDPPTDPPPYDPPIWEIYAEDDDGNEIAVEAEDVYTMVRATTAVDTWVQVKKIGGLWFIDVEGCA